VRGLLRLAGGLLAAALAIILVQRLVEAIRPLTEHYEALMKAKQDEVDAQELADFHRRYAHLPPNQSVDGVGGYGMFDYLGALGDDEGHLE
jgi:hypothetical protein